MLRFTMTAFACLPLLAGCRESSPPPAPRTNVQTPPATSAPNRPGVHVKAPGVDVNVGNAEPSEPDSKVKVRAPGVNVDVKGNQPPKP